MAIDIPADRWKSERQLDVINRALSSIFLDDPQNHSPTFSALSPLDSFHVYTTLDEWTPLSNETGGEGRTQLIEKLVTGLPEYLSSQLSKREPPKRGSFSRVLGGTICDELRARPGVFQRIRVIAFSTWQVLPESTDLRALKQCLGQKGPSAAFLAFYLPVPGNPAATDNSSSTLDIIHSYLPQSQWKELDAVMYNDLPPIKKAAALEGLYTPTAPTTLRVEYFPNDLVASPASILKLPLELSISRNEKIYVSLNVPGRPAQFGLQIQMENNEPPTELHFPEGRGWTILPPHQNSVGLRLIQTQDLPPTSELAIAIPSLAAFYHVQLVFIPIHTHGPTWASFSIIFLMHLFPIPVAWRIWLRRTRHQK